jgi:peroxiredoxin
LRQRYDEFQAAGAGIVVVGMGTPAQTREFIVAQQLPFPVLSDPRRVSHRAYGVLRGTLRQLALNPRVWLHGVAASAAGHTQTQIIGDGKQLSGTFIIDRAGIIRFADRADLSSDYTSPDTLLAALARLPGRPAPPDVS